MIEALIVIGGVIGVAAVGLFVSGRMTKWWSSALYALITASLGLLMIAGFYSSETTSAISLLWYARLCLAATLVAMTCLFFLVQELADPDTFAKSDKLLNRVVGWTAAALFLLSFSPWVLTGVYIIPSTGYFVSASWGSLLYLLFTVGILLLIGYRFVEYARAAYRKRFGLLDVRFALVRTAAYIVTLLSIAAIFFGLVYGASALFVGDVRDATHLGPVTLTAALVVAIIFQAVQRFYSRQLDRLFYKDNYSLSDFALEIGQTLNSTNDLRTLLERVSHVVARTVKASQAFFFVNLLEEDHFMTAGTERHSRVTLAEFEGFHTAARDLPAVITQFDREHPLRRMMASHHLGLIMPLRKGDDLVGFLCLGKSKRLGYTTRDLRALRLVSDELTIAIQNALSVEEVKKLNGTLEQRVDAATHELRTSNAQLQRLDEAKDEFISMASHQLRTPLTSIKGYLSMLIEGDVGPVSKEQKHMLSEAFVSSERMVRLIGDFLNVSRLQTGRFVIEKHPIDLALLVQREIDGLAQNAAARGMKFTYQKPKGIPILELDENKIQQVVMNFADNAIYYSKEGAKITVALKKVGAFVEFTVTDTGIGVPKTEQAHLFNKFFRATNARKARPDGTGVGLFLAKKVIADHHGEIIFESKEGKGSVFGFRLPVPDTAA